MFAKDGIRCSSWPTLNSRTQISLFNSWPFCMCTVFFSQYINIWIWQSIVRSGFMDNCTHQILVWPVSHLVTLNFEELNKSWTNKTESLSTGMHWVILLQKFCNNSLIRCFICITNTPSLPSLCSSLGHCCDPSRSPFFSLGFILKNVFANSHQRLSTCFYLHAQIIQTTEQRVIPQVYSQLASVCLLRGEGRQCCNLHFFFLLSMSLQREKLGVAFYIQMNVFLFLYLIFSTCYSFHCRLRPKKHTCIAPQNKGYPTDSPLI